MTTISPQQDTQSAHINLKPTVLKEKTHISVSKDGLIGPSLDHYTPTQKMKSLNIATIINHNHMIYNNNPAKRSFATGVRKIPSEKG
ncbi:hypothetical protein GOE70_20690 [Salmonella enterica]|nr:hypothetical protein [Salmonella enterica]